MKPKKKKIKNAWIWWSVAICILIVVASALYVYHNSAQFADASLYYPADLY